jgi:hypothetical protein
MSFETMEGQRKDTAAAIAGKFGKLLDKAEDLAATKTSSEFDRKALGAKIALEYAVMATAREKNMQTQVVAAALASTTPAQQAEMIKQGAAALGRTYRVEPDVLVNVFAGKMVDVAMPRGLGSTPEIDKMVDTCRDLVTNIARDEYAMRGRFTSGTYDRDSFVALKSDGVVSPAKSELASRLAFMESAIDAGAKSGKITDANAQFLKERIESQVFQPRPPESMKFSQEFLKFYEQRGQAMRIEAMKEVRAVIQSSTVTEIASKLQVVLPKAKEAAQPAGGGAAKLPADQRTTKPMER